MVEEERTQIGTLKALGYGKASIAGKYIWYALSASLFGSLLGLVVGQKLLPYVIINAYKILYNNLPAIVTPLNFNYSVTSTALAVFCTTIAVVAACYKELLAVPAQLLSLIHILYPIELLKLAGVDMTAKEPVEEALKLFGSLLDEMEEIAG